MTTRLSRYTESTLVVLVSQMYFLGSSPFPNFRYDTPCGVAADEYQTPLTGGRVGKPRGFPVTSAENKQQSVLSKLCGTVYRILESVLRMIKFSGRSSPLGTVFSSYEKTDGLHVLEDHHAQLIRDTTGAWAVMSCR